MRISVTKTDKSFRSDPLACLLQLLLSLLKLIPHFVSNFCLQFFVDNRYKKFVKMGSTHRTSHPHRHDPLVTPKAHKVLARGQHRLSTQAQTDGTFVVVPR